MILLLFFFFPIFSLFIIFLIPSRFKNILFYFGLFSLLFQTLTFLYFINIQNLPYKYSFQWIKFFNINFSLYIDNLSFSLIILNLILYITSLIFSLEEIEEKVKEFLIWSFLILIAINGAFLSGDLFLFYIFFGLLPVPLFFMIKNFGNREIEYSAYKFLIYLLTGSSFLITGILILVFYFKNLNGFFSFDIFELSKISLSKNLERIIFFLFIFPFLINTFIFPEWFFKIIAGSRAFCSVILSGVILKIGIYGIIRIAFQIFPGFSKDISNLIIIISVFTIIYISSILWRQRNFKKILAYLNLFYMGLIMIGIFTFQEEGFNGSILQLFNHGITMGALFIISGSMYKREKTFEIEKIGEIINNLSFLRVIFLISILSIIFFPGLNNFTGTFLIFYSIFKKSIFLFIISILSTMSICLYFLSFLIKFSFRKYKSRKIENLNLKEIISLIPLIFLMFYLGIYPNLWK
ncbi:MAG: NADH-quinone oxidoreductase subunit M [candidate division WOR-3 bacterium]